MGRGPEPAGWLSVDPSQARTRGTPWPGRPPAARCREGLRAGRWARRPLPACSARALRARGCERVPGLGAEGRRSPPGVLAARWGGRGSRLWLELAHRRVPPRPGPPLCRPVHPPSPLRRGAMSGGSEVAALAMGLQILEMAGPMKENRPLV